MGEKRASESSSCRLVEPSRILSVSPASFGVLGRGIFVISLVHWFVCKNLELHLFVDRGSTHVCFATCTCLTVVYVDVGLRISNMVLPPVPY
jgi:hypothetical protein